MNDLINRADAIDALMAWEEDSVWDEECLKHRGESFWISPSDVVENLPSAESEIIRCKECKYYDGSPCEIVDWYNTADDFCSYAERRTDETD